MILCMSLVSCGYDRFGDPGFGRPEGIVNSNADLDLLREYSDAGKLEIPEKLVFEGYVTANDLSGNFYQAVVIQDGTAAVELCAGYYGLHGEFQVGRRVVVKAGGLGLGVYNGVVQIGLKVNPYSTYRVESFGTPHIMGKYVSTDRLSWQVKPAVKGVADLEIPDCGRLVKLEGLTINAEEAGRTWGWSDGNASAGYRIFADAAGKELVAVTGPYASFAEEPVPAGTVSLTGILVYGKFGGTAERFGIKLRDLGDVE